ncbi:MAG: ATP-grasp domain-containing protein [Acidobacteriota bacterium]|nr:ATP-grasp domain-containing protein [Acidobacteriota bacterium]
MRVLMLAPAFPNEMPFFARGLASVGARVVGVGDQPVAALPAMTREALADYLQVPSLFDDDAVLAQVRRYAPGSPIDRVETLWEPLVVLAARLREGLGLPGMTVGQAVTFRDKERMKQVLEQAGVRVPRHSRESTARGCLEAAERIGYPLVVKPIAGAGSADTYKVANRAELEGVLPMVRHVPVVSVEEFIAGEEYTFDTVCAGGRILYYNVSWYRPKPLIARTVEWISPQTVTLRDPDVESLAAGRALGRAVIDALGYRDGFTHMEWFLTPGGEAVFGEIGARPPGARSVEIMNYACDVDLFAGWAEAVVHGRLSQPVERRYNSAIIFKRAHGRGRIRHIAGLESLLSRFGQHVVSVELLPPGAPRRNWKNTLLSDGWIIVRHPHLPTLLHIADSFGTDLQIYAE